MSGIIAGDAVVCVGDFSMHEGEVPTRGTVYRVIDVALGRADDGTVGIGLIVIAARPNDIWNAVKFRKIDPASDKFIEQMRALRPHKVGEPA